MHEVWEKQFMPRGQSRSVPDGHGREQSLVASSKLAPQKLDSGWSPASAMGSMAQVVCAKQVRSSGQSLDRLEGQGSAQLPSASTKLFPQKNESLSAQVVKAKQLMPVGQSPLFPVGHGYSQTADASLRLAPQ